MIFILFSSPLVLKIFIQTSGAKSYPLSCLRTANLRPGASVHTLLHRIINTPAVRTVYLPLTLCVSGKAIPYNHDHRHSRLCPRNKLLSDKSVPPAQRVCRTWAISPKAKARRVAAGFPTCFIGFLFFSERIFLLPLLWP